MKRLVQFLLPLSLLLGIVILAYFRIRHHHELREPFYFYCDIVIIALYAIWIVYEVYVSSVDAGQDNVVRDYGTRELYGLSQALTVFSALWFGPVRTGPGPWHVIGLAVFITAAILALLLVPSIVVRILVEEKTLMSVDGYAEFAKTRKRIFPCVW
ncbi:MAG TPA: hypothetical protein PKN50_13085 [Spirochaetota bacterium]|nr:hypothetical protein [Spirochaetota bacterium]